MDQTDRQTRAEAMRLLMRGWGDRCSRPLTLNPRREGRTSMQAHSVQALTLHTHSLATVLLPYMDDGLTVIHVPTVRAMYETTLTALWLDNDESAAESWWNDLRRGRTNMQRTAGDEGLLKDGEERLAHAEKDPEDIPKSLAKRSSKMTDLCKRVQIKGAYSIYRTLSSEAHPGADCARHYLVSLDGNKGFFRPHPLPDESSQLLSRVAVSTVLWSARLADYLDGNVRRSELREIGRMIGVKPEVGFF